MSEIDKAAIYAVWKELNGKLPSSKIEGGAYSGHLLEAFIQALTKYRTKP